MFCGSCKAPVLPTFSILGITMAAIAVDTIFVETDIKIILIKTVYMMTMWTMGVMICIVIQNNARMKFINLTRIEKLFITNTLTGLHNRQYYKNVQVAELLYYVNTRHSPNPETYERTKDLVPNRKYGIILNGYGPFQGSQ